MSDLFGLVQRYSWRVQSETYANLQRCVRLYANSLGQQQRRLSMPLTQPRAGSMQYLDTPRIRDTHCYTMPPKSMRPSSSHISSNKSAFYRDMLLRNAVDTRLCVSRPSFRLIQSDTPINARRSTPVSTPEPCSMYTTSSVATFPVAPTAYGQPPSPLTDESTTATPNCSDCRILASA